MTKVAQQAVPSVQVDSNGIHTNGNGTHNTPREETQETTHSGKTHNIWSKVKRLKSDGKILLNGSDLDIASVIAVAKYTPWHRTAVRTNGLRLC